MQQETVDRAALARLATDAGVALPPAAVEPLAVYLELLARWNRAMNLVGPHAWREIFNRLVVDSLHLGPFLRRLPLPAAPLTWDLGAGAGLPGVPLRLIWPDGAYYMVEVREKRAIFLSNALARLDLPGTHVFRGAVEHFFQGQCCPADCIVSRAFMPWRELLDLVRDRLRPQGLLVCLALEPAPARLPAPWRCVDQQSYTAAGHGRWLWALSPDAAA